MKDPTHPVGPAFAQARDEAELLRRQQIAALSEPQRKQYEALCRAHEAREQSQRETLRHQEKRQVTDRAQRHLWRLDPRPRPPPSYRKEELAVAQAGPHDRGARGNEAARFIRQRFSEAQTKAAGEIAREHAQVIERTRTAHQRARDTFLERCGRERHMPPDKAREFRGNAPEISWHRALEKAARQEQDRARGHDRDRDYRHDR